MNQFDLIIPGKFFLLGEFSVLEKFPAIVGTIGRYTKISYHEQSQSRHIICKYGKKTESFFIDNKDSEIAKYLAQNLNDKKNFELVIDSNEMFSKDQKLGLGSSASVASGIIELINILNGSDFSLQSKINLAKDFHNTMQQAQGSGADIAGIFYGGATLIAQSGCSKISMLDKYRDHFRVITTPAAKNTTHAIRQFQSWANESDKNKSLLTQMGNTTNAAVDAINQSNLLGFIGKISEFSELLKRLEMSSGIEIFTTHHQEIERIAAEYNVAYKPCGGGGDIGFMAALDPKIFTELEPKLNSLGKVLKSDLFVKGISDLLA